MKKYVNGKLIEMTKEEFDNRKGRRHVLSNKNTANYELQIKTLESKIAELESKLNTSKE